MSSCTKSKRSLQRWLEGGDVEMEGTERGRELYQHSLHTHAHAHTICIYAYAYAYTYTYAYAYTYA